MTDQPDSATDARSQTVPERLVAATIDLLAQVGPSEIKVRRITETAGLSTITVYHHFGGVAELMNAVVAEGYRELTAAMEAAVRCDPDPGAQLFGIALSNRHLAHRNPHLYDMMFGLSTRGTYRSVSPPAENVVGQRFANAYDVFAAASHRLVETGRISVTDGHQVAAELWSFVHGFVTLEGAGHFARFANPLFEVLAPMAIHQFVGMGDERARAEKSAQTALRWWNTEGPGTSGDHAIT